MLILAINLDIDANEARTILAQKARELDYRPANSVKDTADEPYNLIAQLLAGIINNDVDLTRTTEVE